MLREMIDVILGQYTADVTSSAIYGGASVEYSTILFNARQLRDRVFTFSEVIFCLLVIYSSISVSHYVQVRPAVYTLQ